MHSKYDVIVLGGGVAGLSAASIISDKFADTLLLDSFDRIGGSHRSIEANGFTFDVGSFFFHAHTLLFQRHPALLESTLPVHCDHERIRPDGTVAAYPFESCELRELSFRERVVMFLSLLKGRFTIGEDKNVEEACHRMIGKAFYQHSGLSNYVARFYGADLPASKISPTFVAKRLQFLRRRTRFVPAMQTVLGAYLLGSDRKATQGSNQNVVGRVRTEAGFPAMYAPVADDLVRKGVTIKLNQTIQGIQRTEAGFQVTTEQGELHASQIVSTLPIPILLGLIGRGADCNIPSSALLTLCVSFKGTRGFDGGVLFNFHDEGNWKRLTMHSDFYGRRNNREYFSVEVPVRDNKVMSGDQGFRDFVESVQAHGLFRGDLQLEDSEFTLFAYPRYEIGYEKSLEQALAAIDEFGIITVGRQGRHDYLPTAGQVYLQVEEILRPMTAG